MKIKPEARFWDVRFSEPRTKHYKQTDGTIHHYETHSNVHVMVAADSVATVVELVMKEYPNATIHQINHRGGDCGIIVQAELLA